ncbi:pectate lyase [Gimesia fumaroli]|uniref:Pectic acid lyase n=1 Tax=Gimesia fumaroli TaxID=2527976 RepID=A0A518IF25_9PLAN|nr:pectate lyase [Gimesia fumaroli]QDV51670.1 Pectic acid lyase [Gimesia fumaroli]
MRQKKWSLQILVCVLLISVAGFVAERSLFAADAALKSNVIRSMRKASQFYRDKLALNGGYVYYYSLDLQQRWGEGKASPDQIWVQPPGTPTVGMAYLRAYQATGDQFYLDAATDAALALVYGQLKSGGWTNSVDFNPRSKLTAEYRNGKGRGKNNSTLDDGITQSAILLLIRVDQAHEFHNQPIHQAAMIALNALLAAQYPVGAFPQVWTGPVPQIPPKKANFPEYDWRTEGRIKNYWDYYTLNDGLAGYVSTALMEAYQIYEDDRYRQAVLKLGDFLIEAQLPAPQTAWAQQYNFEMQPIWARKFEPPAVTGGETQDVIQTLMNIYHFSGDRKYLKPIPSALTYLKKSQLPDGQLARYYELKTNRPLYMSRRGKKYSLTYDDSDLPRHYGWKIESHLNSLQREFNALKSARKRKPYQKEKPVTEAEVKTILKDLGSGARWVSTSTGERLVGQPKFPVNSQYISSAVFSRNLELLSDFLESLKTD